MGRKKYTRRCRYSSCKNFAGDATAQPIPDPESERLTFCQRPGAAPPGGQGGGADCPPNCRTGEQYYVFAPADFLEAP